MRCLWAVEVLFFIILVPKYRLLPLNITYIPLMGIANWIGAMVGYDKVKQAIEQLGDHKLATVNKYEKMRKFYDNKNKELLEAEKTAQDALTLLIINGADIVRK